MSPKSSSLFHFTRSLEFLKGIVQNGFKPRYCLEDTRYLGINYIGLPMCCFCDIPISRIQEHTSFYGEYGLGMTKDWGARSRLEPLLYAPADGAITSFINYYVNEKRDVHPDQKEMDDGHLARLLGLTKPVHGNMLVSGKVTKKDFYQENEWRFVPPNYEILLENEFEAGKDIGNIEMESFALKFSPLDVKYIFVRSDAEIPVIFDFIHNNLGHWPLNEIKILTSRITSLETIAKDV